MLEALITSKTRIKLLLKFFLNSSNTGYLRSLEPEFGGSTNAIRHELIRFEEAGLLIANVEGNKKIYRANTDHPLFPEINSLVMKYVGLDQILNRAIKGLGKLEELYLVGQLANGLDNETIQLWFVGQDIEEEYLKKLIGKVKGLVSRTVKYVILSTGEFAQKQNDGEEKLLLWKNISKQNNKVS